jgi:chorismate mutase
VDLLWIGARTSVNPILVRELAGCLAGVDIPVLVKNPVNPDLDAWIGALERFDHVGIRRLGAVHRGFSTLDNGPFRNAPQWQIPIRLMSLLPDLPVLCDPSHIAGSRALLFPICVKALEIGAHGFMIESHIHPDEALSDGEQQLKPHDLHDFLRQLNIGTQS